tara:strand:+ start:1070 stop:1546 length:477 start_codon:yes stop_codon:yes gene_type:complete
MKNVLQEELTKLQVVCSLFSETVGDDLYYAQQIKETIEASLPKGLNRLSEPFIKRAKELVDKIEGTRSTRGFGFVDANASDSPFSLLEMRVHLLDVLKATCRFDSGLIVITGLKEAICPEGTRWSQSRKLEYQEAIAFARRFCQERSRPSARLSLIIL